jgi:hypothetical protein
MIEHLCKHVDIILNIFVVAAVLSTFRVCGVSGRSDADQDSCESRLTIVLFAERGIVVVVNASVIYVKGRSSFGGSVRVMNPGLRH